MIKEIREALGLTQKQLGVRSRLKQTAIARLEQPNYNNPRIQTLIRVLGALGYRCWLEAVPKNSKLSDIEKYTAKTLGLKTVSSKGKRKKEKKRFRVIFKER